MLKIILIIASLFILGFFIKKFYPIHSKSETLTPNNIPDLSKPLENELYKIQNVTKNAWNEIRYDPVNDFYLVAQNDKITKLNNKGEVTFQLNMNEKDINNMPDFMDYHRPSSFVISWYGIYDLSKEKPELEKFEQKLNDDMKMEQEEWMEHFNDLYNHSDIVLWGFRKAFGSGKHPLYFRQNGQWKILYTLKNVSQINTNKTFTKFRINYTQEYVPDKSNKLYLLKDIDKNGAYSDYNNFDNGYNNRDYEEIDLEYGKEAKIETISYDKEVTRDAPYSHTPVTSSGTAVNKLSIGNTSFIFKTKATKGVRSDGAPLHTFFYLFTVPSKFKTENSLNFLYYKYPTNWNSDENGGVYVIIKKTK